MLKLNEVKKSFSLSLSLALQEDFYRAGRSSQMKYDLIKAAFICCVISLLR